MRCHPVTRFGTIVLLVLTCSSCAAFVPYDAEEGALDQLFAAYTGEDVPGAAVLVIHEGDPVYRKAFGMANLEEGIPVKTHTNFRLASVTKQFTAMGILQLVDQGKLTLETTLDAIFTDFPAYGEAITIRHLLQHTGGLVAYESLVPDTATVQVHDADVLAMMHDEQGTVFTPGTQYSYSNTGYAVLASVIEVVSGQSYPAYMKAHIFAPLEMTGSVAYQAGLNTVPERAYGYTVSGDAVSFSDQSLTSAVLGDGGIYSSIDDLFRWDQALYTETLVSNALMDEAVTPGLEGYGFGWRIGTYNGHLRHSHTGSTRGFRTVIQRFPEEALTVIILTNRNGPAVATLADQLADHFL